VLAKGVLYAALRQLRLTYVFWFVRRQKLKKVKKGLDLNVIMGDNVIVRRE
jgi:hypothetical protein